LGDVNKLFVFKRLLTTPNNVLPLKFSFKNLRNLPHGFGIYLVNVKTMRQIAQIFVAFSEKLSFTPHAKFLANYLNFH
jgi:hypothetical protein